MSDKTGPYTLKKLHTATYGADAYTIDGPTDIMGVWKGSEGAVRIGQMNAAYAAGAASNTPPDPDAHLTGDAYLEAKQKRCAVWMKGQSAEEIEREMRGEPSKAILLPMGEEVDAILLSDCDNMYHEDHGSVMFATTDCVTKLFANSKAVSIERMNKCVDDEEELPGGMPDEMWEACRNDRDAMTQAFRIVVRLTKKGIRERLNNLTK